MTELWDIDPIKNKKYIDTMIKKGNALDVKEVVACFDFAFSRGRGANIRDLVTNQKISLKVLVTAEKLKIFMMNGPILMTNLLINGIIKRLDRLH